MIIPCLLGILRPCPRLGIKGVSCIVLVICVGIPMASFPINIIAHSLSVAALSTPQPLLFFIHFMLYACMLSHQHFTKFSYIIFIFYLNSFFFLQITNVNVLNFNYKC